MRQVELPLKQMVSVLNETGVKFDSVPNEVAEGLYNIGVDEILNDVAMHQMIAMERELVALEHNAIYKGKWSDLSDMDNELCDQLSLHVREVADKTFIAGFIEGYKMMKKISMGRE